MQVTLFIAITHYKRVIPEDDDKAADEAKSQRAEPEAGPRYEIVSEAHIGVSSDMKHDTHFVQHFMRRFRTTRNEVYSLECEY